MKLNLIAPVNTLGYGVVGYNILKELSKQKIDVSWWPIGMVESPVDQGNEFLQQAINNQGTYSNKSTSIKVWHQFDLAQTVGKGLHCGFPIFELNALRKNEINHLSQQDIIFTPTMYHSDILLLYEKIKKNSAVCLTPLGVDTDVFKPSDEIKPDHNWTTFLNCGKWEVRKGHDILVQAFNKAFSPRDRTRLWMLTNNPFLHPSLNKGVDGNAEWERLYGNSNLGAHISFLPRLKYHEYVAKLMQEVDCGVFPSRAEGWNLEALEMMACGKEVILTNYSGHTEFANQHNAHLLEVTATEEAYDGKWFFGHKQGFGNWAALDSTVVDQLVEAMRQVHKNKQEEGQIINKAGIATANIYTWTNTVNMILKHIGEGDGRIYC